MYVKVLGLDIGGTKIRGILWDGKRVYAARQAKTPATMSDMLAEIQRLTKFLIYAQSRISRISRIGIGMAGVIKQNLLIESPNIKYAKNLDLAEVFINVYHGLNTKITVKLDNDARCFLRAEIRKDRLLRRGKILGITIGTGIGRAFAENGRVFKIKQLEYPEKWEPEYQKIRNSKNNRKLAAFLAEKLTMLINKYPADIIATGGGVSERKNFMPLFRSALKKTGLKTRVFKAKLGQNSGALGAAMLYKN